VPSVVPGVAGTVHRVVPSGRLVPDITVTVPVAVSPFFVAVIVVVPAASAVSTGGSSVDSSTMAGSLLVQAAALMAEPKSSTMLNVAASSTSSVRIAGASVSTVLVPIRVTRTPRDVLCPAASRASSTTEFRPGRSGTVHVATP
jgi:hypothetical protein